MAPVTPRYMPSILFALQLPTAQQTQATGETGPPASTSVICSREVRCCKLASAIGRAHTTTTTTTTTRSGAGRPKGGEDDEEEGGRSLTAYIRERISEYRDGTAMNNHDTVNTQGGDEKEASWKSSTHELHGSWPSSAPWLSTVFPWLSSINVPGYTYYVL